MMVMITNVLCGDLNLARSRMGGSQWATWNWILSWWMSDENRKFWSIWQCVSLPKNWINQSCCSNSVMNVRSVPFKLDSIHISMRAFNSGEKWFFQSPVFPNRARQFLKFSNVTKFTKNKNTLTKILYTFADEIATVVHETQFFANFIVNGFILGELIDA